MMGGLLVPDLRAIDEIIYDICARGFGPLEDIIMG